MKDRFVLVLLVLILACSIGFTLYETMVIGDFEVTHTEEWESAGEEEETTGEMYEEDSIAGDTAPEEGIIEAGP